MSNIIRVIVALLIVPLGNLASAEEAALDPGSAPLADPASKPPEDWCRFIDDLMPAIQACILSSGGPVSAVSKAWPMNRGFAGVRLIGTDGRRYDCIVTTDGRRIERVEELTPESVVLPGEGEPTFHPARETPPVIAVGRLERVIDAAGKVLGWLHYRTNSASTARDADDDRLIGTVWLVEDIEGHGVLDLVQSTIEFGGKAAIAGSTGCNSFRGRVSLGKGQIEFGRLATTRRACPPAVMDQERRYLSMLERVSRWRIDRGLLFLADSAGRDLLRLAPIR